MSIDVSCSGCGKAYAVPDERAGQRFKCKACGTAVSVPADELGNNSAGSSFGNSANAGGFGSVDYNNLYATSGNTSASSGRTSRAEALSKTNICAIFLYILGGMSILMYLANAVITIAAPGLAGGPGMPPAANEAERVGQLVGALGASAVFILTNTLVILGAYHLQNLRKYWLAMTGAIIACIPCCGPCLVLGIPFGIWALVLLNNPEIKPHFKG